LLELFRRTLYLFLQLSVVFALSLFTVSISLAGDIYKLAAKEFKNKNYQKVIHLFEPLCKKGDKVACYNAGVAYEYINKSHKAISLYKKSCGMGFSEACFYLGELYKSRKKFNDSLMFYEKACDYNKFEGCYAAASLIIGNEKEKDNGSDVKKALNLLEKACNNEIYDACLLEGVIYMNGEGVKKNPIKAFNLFEQICKLNYLPGCSLLGTMYENGMGVLPDMLLAEKYYKMSCKGGFIPACVDLGSMYLRKGEISKGIELYKMACDNNIALGCRNLAVTYRSGDGVPRDINKAIKLYKKACDLGDKGSCNYLEIWASEPKLFDMPIGATSKKEFFYVARQKHWKLEKKSWIIADGVTNPEVTGYAISGITLKHLSKSVFWFVRIPSTSSNESVLWKVDYKFNGDYSVCSEYAKILKLKYGSPSEDYILNKAKEISIWDFKYSMVVLSCPLRKSGFDLTYVDKKIREYVNEADNSILRIKARSYEGL